MDKNYSDILWAERGTCTELSHGSLVVNPNLPYLTGPHDGEDVLLPKLHAAVARHLEDDCTNTALLNCTILG
jgi:hypothetical protein